jgi:predicted CXXCH cytochrome family protein
MECHDVAADPVARAHAPFGATPGRCTSCHDPHLSGASGLLGALQHQPFKDRECGSCHPAGRPIVAAELAATCADCHDLAKASRHRPVRQGRCVACHTPHASSRPHLLIDAAPALCDRCHDRRAQRWKKLHADAGAEGMDCLDCHDAHMSKQK